MSPASTSGQPRHSYRERDGGENDVKNEYGQFMHFETLTWVPIDREAIDEKYLNDTQIKYLHEYQKTVYEKISPI